jgi:hypothetical protein
VRARPIVLVLAIAACRSAPPPEPSGGRGDVQPVTPPDAGTPPDSGVIDAGAAPAEMPIADYRTVYLRELARLTKTREAAQPEADVIRAGDAAIPHAIDVLKKIGQAESFVVTTTGFGRIAHGTKGRAHVELLAYVEQYGPKIGRVLVALGETMHAKSESGAAWKEYDTVQLPAPEQGMEYFDLRPAGEVDVSPELRVTLLKVIPMSHEEYQRAQKNPAGEWDDPNATARARQRWRRLLER